MNKRTPSSPWPKGARCAVMLTFDFDAETLWLARDPKTADSPGVMSQGRYGAKVGVPRLLRLRPLCPPSCPHPCPPRHQRLLRRPRPGSTR